MKGVLSFNPPCLTCKQGTVATRHRGQGKMVHCAIFGRMPLDISDCSRYAPVNAGDMHWGATIVEPIQIDGRRNPGNYA